MADLGWAGALLTAGVNAANMDTEAAGAVFHQAHPTPPTSPATTWSASERSTTASKSAAA